MNAGPAFIRTFTVAGFTAEVSIPRLVPGSVASAVVEWSPRVPFIDTEFSPAERAKYQRLLLEAIQAAGA